MKCKMDLLKVIFVKFIAHVIFVYTAYTENTYLFSKKCEDGILPTSMPFETYNVSDLDSCVLRCLLATTCVSVGRTSASCFLYTRKIAECNENNTILQDSAVYFEKSDNFTGLGYDSCENGGTWNNGTCICDHSWVGSRCERLPKDCSEVYDFHVSARGEQLLPYTVQPSPTMDAFQVMCYMNYGGWTYILKRTNGCEEDFNRTWVDYQTGFGDLIDFNCDFWLGLDKMHALTNVTSDYYDLDIVISLQPEAGFSTFTQAYYDFKVDGQEADYKISLANYRIGGNTPTGDSLLNPDDPFTSAVNMSFSTYDNDNDNSADQNCAANFGAGWWFNNCTSGILTGYKYVTDNGIRNNSISSIFWKYDLDDYAISGASVKIRTKS